MSIQEYLDEQEKIRKYNPSDIIKYLQKRYQPISRSADNKINSQSKNMDEEEKTEETTPETPPEEPKEPKEETPAE